MTAPIVVGIDGREPSGALEFSAALARGMETELVLVHVAGEPVAFPYGNVRLQELMRRETVTECNALLSSAGAHVLGVVREMRVEFGTPGETLRRIADELEASLIVLFPRERRRITRVLWRGTSGTVAASSPCPVVIVPRSLDRSGSAGARGGPIVVGADTSNGYGRAVAVADALSDRLDLPVLPVGIDIAGEAARGRTRFRNAHRRRGEALAEIARRVRGALLVVGTGGGSRPSGSVAQRLIGETSMPLVVVPERPDHA